MKRFLVLVTSPQQSDLRLSGRPSGQGAGSWARTHDRSDLADLRVDSLATVPPTPRNVENKYSKQTDNSAWNRIPCTILPLDSLRHIIVPAAKQLSHALVCNA
ncbi:hypothetical protein PoB_000422700 [Plakobranchus ocellatus]|uniref:Uncharacterized protein n=1 Tax=Plakobranchus ocellatus TaxID=259542 RepID=A0AAV3Y6J4_9GAST|nr:hypothetical protein PoB_000422700 [Plakobranchus ocellatus]